VAFSQLMLAVACAKLFLALAMFLGINVEKRTV